MSKKLLAIVLGLLMVGAVALTPSPSAAYPITDGPDATIIEDTDPIPQGHRIIIVALPGGGIAFIIIDDGSPF